MKSVLKALSVLFAVAAVLSMAAGPVDAQQKKPNILFIMGDDIGWMQTSIYHQRLMVGETPNIDRIHLDKGQVGLRIAADDFGFEFALILEQFSGLRAYVES
jgi:hypothetical protein